MTVSLTKGGNASLVDLHKQAGGDGNLSKAMLGLGWAQRTTSGADFDLDASCFVVDDAGNVLGDNWFIFFGNVNSPDASNAADANCADGSVHHLGDNLTGAGAGDDEQIAINLAKLPATAEKVVFAATIYEAAERSQNFGQVKDAFIRLVDPDSGAELARYDLGEDFSLETAVVFGELYRNNGAWKFKAVGQGYNNGLKGLCLDHGVHVA